MEIAAIRLRNYVALATLAVAGSCQLRSRLLQPIRRADDERIDVSRLYVASTDSCLRGDYDAPAPAEAPATPNTTDTANAKWEYPGEAVVTLFARGSKCWLHLTAWNDANGNGQVDSGDALGSLPAAVFVEDGGLNWCGDDPTDGELLVLPIVR